MLPSPGLIQSLAGLSGPGSYTAPAAEARGCNENWSQESMWGIWLTTQYESCFIPSHQQRDCALHKNLSPTLRNSSSPTLHGSPLLPQRANTSSTRPPARLSALIPSDFLPCSHTLGLNPDTKMPPSHSHYLNASGFFWHCDLWFNLNYFFLSNSFASNLHIMSLINMAYYKMMQFEPLKPKVQHPRNTDSLTLLPAIVCFRYDHQLSFSTSQASHVQLSNTAVMGVRNYKRN